MGWLDHTLALEEHAAHADVLLLVGLVRAGTALTRDTGHRDLDETLLAFVLAMCDVEMQGVFVAWHLFTQLKKQNHPAS